MELQKELVDGVVEVVLNTDMTLQDAIRQAKSIQEDPRLQNYAKLLFDKAFAKW